MDIQSVFATLPDDDLIAETKRLVACERAATARLLQSLIEIDTRRLYLREGCSSLFTYCTQVLHLAEGAAYNRIEAARAARRFPVILDALATGAVSLTTVRLLSPHLTADNHRELLEAAHHKSKRDVEILIVTVKPTPPAATIIRKVSSRPEFVNSPQPCASLSPRSDAPEIGSGSVGESDHPTESRPDQSRRNARLPAVTSPLSRDEYKLQLTISRETHDKLRPSARSPASCGSYWRCRSSHRSRSHVAARPPRAAAIRSDVRTAGKCRGPERIRTPRPSSRETSDLATR